MDLPMHPAASASSAPACANVSGLLLCVEYRLCRVMCGPVKFSFLARSISTGTLRKTASGHGCTPSSAGSSPARAGRPLSCWMTNSAVPHSIFGAQEVLVVERFDRQWATRGSDGAPWIARLPQEDFCQVPFLPSSRKYEADRGPGMRECLRVLLASAAPQADITHFLCAQSAFWLLAATDGHGKDFSLFLLRGGAYRMTPLYDVISLWPVVGRGPNHAAWPAAKLAMAVRSRNVHCALQTIQPRHWRGLAEKAGVAGVWESMRAMVERVEPAIATREGQLPQGFPKQTAGKVFEGMRSQLRTWRNGLDAA